MTIKLAQRILFLAGIYGVLVITPLLFLEKHLSERFPPAITHPELYYGFVTGTLAWQIGYLIMARDPLRYRPMLLAAIVSKAGYAISVLILVIQKRVDAMNLGLAAIDFTLAMLFLWIVLSLRDEASPSSN